MARKGLSAALCELHKNLYPNLPHLTETGGSRPKTGRPRRLFHDNFNLRFYCFRFLSGYE